MQRAFIGLFLDGMGKMTFAWHIFCEHLVRTDLRLSAAGTKCMARVRSRQLVRNIHLVTARNGRPSAARSEQLTGFAG